MTTHLGKRAWSSTQGEKHVFMHTRSLPSHLPRQSMSPVHDGEQVFYSRLHVSLHVTSGGGAVTPTVRPEVATGGGGA